MKLLKNIVLGILNTVFRFSMTALAVVLVYRFAMYSYHFGYMVFADASKEPEPGRDIVITAENTEDIMSLGRMLENRGLIEDARIFFVQERLSDYHGKLMPGTYTLNTSMKAGKMLEIMAADYVDEENPEDSDEEKEEESETAKSPAAMQQEASAQEEESSGYYDPETGEYIETGSSETEGTDTADQDGEVQTSGTDAPDSSAEGTDEDGTEGGAGASRDGSNEGSGSAADTSGAGKPFSAGAGL